MYGTDVRRVDAGPWLLTIRTAAEELDGGLAELLAHLPHMAHERSASSVVPEADLAATRLVDTLSRHTAEFIREQLTLGHTVWSTFRQEYEDATLDVYRVKAELDIRFTELLGCGRFFLAETRFAVLGNERRCLHAATADLLARAEMSYVARRCLPTALASSS
jgi:hypothetical protein